MSAFDTLVMELEREAAVTTRLLERIPEEHLSWKPHEKSMSLGQLAMHIATTPGGIANALGADSFQVDPARFNNVPGAASRQEILDALAKSVAQAKDYLSGLDSDHASATWRLMADDKELMAAPRTRVIRSVMLNHWYHHRGQMTVYLRLLNVQLPAIYGRSADESAFD